jgi:alkaline phosphatase
MVSVRLATVAALTLAAVGCGDSTPHVENIILVIGDGMNLAHEHAASRYLFGSDTGLSFHSFPYQVPVTTWDVTTYDRYAFAAGAAKYDPTTFRATLGYDPALGGRRPLDSSVSDGYFLTPLRRRAAGTPALPATDSASAATAWATGHKTDDGNIAWLPGDPTTGGNRGGDGSLKTIAELFREHKRASIGVVSTVPFNHATPAGHVSHNVSRNHHYTGYRGYAGLGIADEIIDEVKPDVVIGAGHNRLTNPTWDTTKGYISQRLFDTLRSSTEYVFAERVPGADGGACIQEAADQAVAQQRKLFGLFGGQTFYPDGTRADGDLFEPPVPAHSPGSPRVTRATRENPLLSEAAVAALTVLSRDTDGFFLMVEQGDIDWANHANDFRWMIGAMWDLDEAVKAIKAFVDRTGDDVTWDNTLLIVASDHSNGYMRNVRRLGPGELPSQVYTPAAVSPTGYVRNWSYPGGEVTYATTGHTNELTMLYAYGHDAMRFIPYEGLSNPNARLIDNTHIFRLMVEVSGIPES